MIKFSKSFTIYPNQPFYLPQSDGFEMEYETQDYEDYKREEK